MSSPRRLRLTERAEEDFAKILRYTGETWSEAQLLIYRDKIDAALQLLAGNLQLGHRSERLPSTHRLYAVGSHVIVYKIEGDEGAVLRILHQRMSLPKHL
jgi:toxin ParE1/3/4